jgi:hypothetical protein
MLRGVSRRIHSLACVRHGNIEIMGGERRRFGPRIEKEVKNIGALEVKIIASYHPVEFVGFLRCRCSNEFVSCNSKRMIEIAWTEWRIE